MTFIKKNWPEIVVWFLIIVYIVYFSFFTILRKNTLYASYFDLGIMNQTVYNTFQAIKTKDFSRFLEQTNPFGPDQIKRMAIHNDILLAIVSPLYFIYSGPETLLVVQAIVLGLGAWFIFKLTQIILEKNKYRKIIALVFALAYLFYVPMQRANQYEFHAVTLATTFLLAMFYYWLVKKPGLSLVFFILSILSKEQVALTTAFFGLYILYDQYKNKKQISFFGITILLLSIGWFFYSMFWIIPYFRGEAHFALKYYGDFGESLTKILWGIIRNPVNLSKYILRLDTLNYFWLLLGSVIFLPILAPLQFLICLPELGINLLSSSWSMKGIYFQYTAVITSFVFISAIYGFKNLTNLLKKNKRLPLFMGGIIIIVTLLFSYFEGPLPLAKKQEVHPFKYPQREIKDTIFWADTLKNESYKISSTGQLAPFFTSRRYFYTFSDSYSLADYIVLRPNEIYNYPEKDQLIPIYQKLQKDKKFELIYKKDNFEVYKKILNF